MLPVMTFDAREAAARIGLPPLAADGEVLLQAIHAETMLTWQANTLTPMALLSTLVDDAAARAVNSYQGDPSIPMNCASGQIETAWGVMRGTPQDLAMKRAQFLAQFFLGMFISKVKDTDAHSKAYPRHRVNFMRDGEMGSELSPMPAAGPVPGQFSVSCFIQDHGTAQGSIECDGARLPWQYSNGVLGLPSAASVEALGVTAAWARVAVSAAMSASTATAAR
jgi:hypothetical protein